MAIRVRKGAEKDFPAIMEMINELAAFEKAPHPPTNSVGQMHQEKECFEFFVAEEDGRIVGSAIYFFAYYTWVGKSLYLDDIYVKPDFRGRGVGSLLLRNIFELAKQENCKRLRWQVLDWNENAISFYKKRGAAISREWLNCDFDEEGIGNFLKRNLSGT